MKFQFRRFLLLTVVSLCTLGSVTIQSALAQPPLPKESGFSGYIEILGMYGSTDSQMNTESDNSSTDSLEDSGETVRIFRAVPVGLINYTFADIRTQLFAGVLPENVVEGQFQIEAGVRHDLTGGTVLRASVLPTAPVAEETWKDPFVTGLERRKTDSNSYGFKLAVEDIGGSGFSFKYGWATQDIEDEESGTFLLSQPDSTLTTEDLEDLDRDTTFHRVSGDYVFGLMPRLQLKTILKYTRSDAEGDANSYHSLAPQLSFTYFGNQYFAAFNVTWTPRWYDESHPVFDETRQDNNLSLSTILSFNEPFGMKNIRVDWLNAYSRQTSNIDFYESTGYFSAFGIAYKF